MNITSLVTALGLVCVLLLSVLFAVSAFADMRTDMKERACAIADVLSGYGDWEPEQMHAFCVEYEKSFQDHNHARFQFVDADGVTVIPSDPNLEDNIPQTPDYANCMREGKAETFYGRDPVSGKRIISASSPVVDLEGRLIGVVRLSSGTEHLNHKIVLVLAVSILALVAMACVVCFCTAHYMRCVISPVEQITEKAKRIAGGTYGIQIKTKYDDEIGELANTINELSSQIAQNEKTQTEFISSLSHELRTPLTAITGWSETLMGDDSLSPDAQRGIRIISKEAKRLTEMVVDLLDFTRIQDGRMTLNVEPADIRGEFEDTVFMYSSRLAQDGIALEYLDNDDDIPEIPCDAKRLRQVFLNILDNAAKHGGEGKRIEASIHFEDSRVVVRIRDFGTGIPEDEIPLVKKKFYKGSSKARGSGIGLAVCDEIVQMHGGELFLDNAEGGGTLVTVSLPVVQ